MHNIHYRDYPENISIITNFKFLKTSSCFLVNKSHFSGIGIDQGGKGWYDQLAVKYVDRHKNKDDSKMKALTEASVEAMNEYNRRDRIIYPQTLQASLITCKKCNSKLAKSYLKSNLCPVCRTDLRPEHILKSIESAKNKWDRKQQGATYGSITIEKSIKKTNRNA